MLARTDFRVLMLRGRMTHTVELRISGGKCSGGEDIEELHDDKLIITQFDV
jgi:hypothetical protein